jgi:hypothetical protein
MIVRLPFQPGLHGFHFRNAFRNHYTGGFPPVSTAGLCGGMALAAFNYFRYGLPIPPHTDAEIDFNVNFELLRTLPGTTDLVDYIFHSQVATYENSSILAFIGPVDPSFNDEFGKVRARIDRGQYLSLGLKLRPGVDGLGHQVLCYGYDPDTQAVLVYDPNCPDEEVTITAQRVGNENFLHLQGAFGSTDDRYRAMFEQQELFVDRVSDRVTYDMADNIARNLNFSVRPPLVNTQEGWRWCRKCQGMWFGLDPAVSCCPAGGPHTHEGSGLYQLPMDYRASSGQSAWRWCRKCQGLFFGGDHLSLGVCPEGGQHDGTASANYTMLYGTPGNADWTQGNWRWCDKCQGMHYGVGGICPAGGAHNPSQSANYVMLMTT